MWFVLRYSFCLRVSFSFLNFLAVGKFFPPRNFFVLFINTVYGAAAYCAKTLTLCGFPGSFPISKGPTNDVKGPTFDVFGQKSAHFFGFFEDLNTSFYGPFAAGFCVEVIT